MNARNLVALAMLLPELAFGHPGHGTTEPASWMHYLTEPVHALTLAVVVVAVLAIWVRHALITKRTRR